MAAAQNKFSSNLVAIAGLITAIAGLVTVLHQTGVFSPKDTKESIKKERKNIVEPQNLVSDSQTKDIINTSGKTQEDVDAIKRQLEDTQAQLDEMKEVGSKKSILTTPVNNYETNNKTILTGTWQDAINYGRYVLAQDNHGNLTFQEHSIIENAWMVTAEGTGNIENRNVVLNYSTLYSTGQFNGYLQDDGSIKGVASDLTSGIQTQLHLRRQ